jgi:hypothetical protein
MRADDAMSVHAQARPTAASIAVIVTRLEEIAAPVDLLP